MIHSTLVCRMSAFAVALLAVVPAAAHDGQRDVPHRSGVQWCVDLPAALTTAREEKRIVVICFNMDGEAANERALDMYRSDDFADALENAICVMCSADAHASDGKPCTRFRGLCCAEHQACERSARAHLFGAVRNNIAPQHVVLYPDGVVAWHGVYEVEPPAIYRAIRDAEASKGAPLAQRVRRQKLAVEQLKRRATAVPGAQLQILAALASTPAQHFLDTLQVLDVETANSMLDDLAMFRAELAESLLAAATKHRQRAVRERATRLLAQVRERVACDPTKGKGKVAPAGVDAKARAVESPAAPIPITEKLPVVGTPDPLGRVYWVNEAPDLKSCRGKITVLWFFQPDAPDLAAEATRINEYARKNADAGVRVLGCAVALRPSDALEGLAKLGCAFPVGAYQATNEMKFFGIERFPAWCVLDPDAQLVFKTPQTPHPVSKTAALDLARTMATSPVYAPAVGATPPQPTR